MIRVGLVCVLILSTTGCSKPVAPSVELLDFDEPVQEFCLTERSGRPLSRSDLLGKVWIAAFSFSCCTTHCPQVSGSLARLQTELAGEPDVRFVTFSVDPELDTPEVLREYAERYGADPEKWLMVTGKKDELYSLCRESFKLAVEDNPAKVGGEKVTHSPRLIVVDRRSHVRGFFDGRQVDEMGQPIDDLPKLKAAVLLLLRESR